MGIDDYLRQQRKLTQALGLRASAVEQALKLSRPFDAELGILSEKALLGHAIAAPRSVADEIARGQKMLPGDTIGKFTRDHLGVGPITDFLRGQDAFSTKALVGNIGAATAADALVKQQRRLDSVGERFAGLVATGGVARSAARATVPNVIQEALRAQTAARASLWASNIDGHSSMAMAAALNVSRGIDGQLNRLTRAAAGIVRAGELAPTVLSMRALDRHSDATALKLSAFGGSLDLFGPSAPAGQAAFDALFGRWHMRSDLPAGFFRDPAVRTRVYRDAEVDAGLVDASSAEVVELLVESGAVAGERVGGRIRAVVEIGPLRMTVTAGRARHDAYRAIDGFEVALRAFVATRLASACEADGQDPAKWFTARVPGNIVSDAMRVRRDAYKAGEPKQPLISFTNLGELITIITTNRNWTAVFEPVFADRDGFKVDLQRLTAHRRPAMHARPIDGPRLAEILLMIRRLTASMEADGNWDAGWDDDI